MIFQFLVEHWKDVLLTLVTTGALGACRHFFNQAKRYKALVDEKNIEAIDEQIEEKLNPIIEEVEKLREYIRKVDQAETHKMDLIIDSYKFRLVQLCKIYIKQGYMTASQYDQLSEFYKLYTSLGGNGQAKQYFEKASQLEIRVGD